MWSLQQRHTYAALISPSTVPLPRFIAVFCKEKHPEDTIFSALSYFQNKSLESFSSPFQRWKKVRCHGVPALLWIFRNYSPCPTQQDEIAIRTLYWDQILFSLSILFFASSPQSQNQCCTFRHICFRKNKEFLSSRLRHGLDLVEGGYHHLKGFPPVCCN